MFNLFDYDNALDEINKVAAEPIDDEPYSIVANPKPVVESVCDLNGVKIDMTGWSKGEGVDTASKKVGKAKTAPNAKLTSETAKKTTGEKKDDGKIVEKVDASEKKDDGKVTEVKTATEVEDKKAPKATSSEKSFDSTAKSAQSSNKSGADSKKKKLPDNDIPAKVKIFENAVMSMAIDAKSREDVKKVMEAFAPLKAAMLESTADNVSDVKNSAWASGIVKPANPAADRTGAGLTQRKSHNPVINRGDSPDWVVQEFVHTIRPEFKSLSAKEMKVERGTNPATKNFHVDLIGLGENGEQSEFILDGIPNDFTIKANIGGEGYREFNDMVEFAKFVQSHK